MTHHIAFVAFENEPGYGKTPRVFRYGFKIYLQPI